MIWDILREKIVTAGLAVAGQTLFLDEMASDVSIGVMLKSPLSGIDVDHNLPNYYKPNLQVIVRHNDPVDGDRLANQVLAALTVETPEHYAANAERGAVQINMFVPRKLPIRYPRLTGGGIEWSLQFITSFSIQPL